MSSLPTFFQKHFDGSSRRSQNNPDEDLKLQALPAQILISVHDYIIRKTLRQKGNYWRVAWHEPVLHTKARHTLHKHEHRSCYISVKLPQCFTIKTEFQQLNMVAWWLCYLRTCKMDGTNSDGEFISS